jgi:hypothetical protein
VDGDACVNKQQLNEETSDIAGARQIPHDAQEEEPEALEDAGPGELEGASVYSRRGEERKQGMNESADARGADENKHDTHAGSRFHGGAEERGEGMGGAGDGTGRKRAATFTSLGELWKQARVAEDDQLSHSSTGSSQLAMLSLRDSILDSLSNVVAGFGDSMTTAVTALRPLSNLEQRVDALIGVAERQMAVTERQTAAVERANELAEQQLAATARQTELVQQQAEAAARQALALQEQTELLCAMREQFKSMKQD